jgi:hypothetical protein
MTRAVGLRTIYQRANLPIDQLHVFRPRSKAVREMETRQRR